MKDLERGQGTSWNQSPLALLLGDPMLRSRIKGNDFPAFRHMTTYPLKQGTT